MDSIALKKVWVVPPSTECRKHRPQQGVESTALNRVRVVPPSTGSREHLAARVGHHLHLVLVQDGGVDADLLGVLLGCLLDAVALAPEVPWTEG